MHETSIN